MKTLVTALAVTAGVANLAAAQTIATQTPDLAAAFGAREAITHASLSPDGTKIAFVGPGPGKGTILYSFDTAKGGAPKAILTSSGELESISRCGWVSNDRLACNLVGISQVDGEIIEFDRLIAVDAVGGRLKQLSKSRGNDDAYYSKQISFSGGTILDYGKGDGRVLMTRLFVPEERIGSLIEKRGEGLGVDELDTLTLQSRHIEPPRVDASEYISDGKGQIRIIGNSKSTETGMLQGVTSYMFRLKNERNWKPLSEVGVSTGTGFHPYAVDAEKDVAYGFEKVDGRQRLVSVSLADEKLDKTVLSARDDVDVDGLVTFGRKGRVVGATYATVRRETVYFDPALQKLSNSLRTALPKQPLIKFVDASSDESRLLIWAGGDTSPGTYYLFDRSTKRLQPIMPVRPALEGVGLSNVRAITFPAADGTMIPAYLTLPSAGADKNLPAIVMPHGGPSARDEWGFDWLAQYFASKGFAVLQPNYRGSSGFGDAWYQNNGFKSWKTAVGDVNDGGRWLVKSGTGNPQRLSILGWSYGGYAALQSAVLDPTLFKAIVAVAPVTDLEMLKSESVGFTNRRLVEQFVGSGNPVVEGSPARNADRISAPVLIFHGTLDGNVSIRESRFMLKQMQSAGKKAELIEFPGLEHSLVDSSARAELLRKSSDFLLSIGK